MSWWSFDSLQIEIPVSNIEEILEIDSIFPADSPSPDLGYLAVALVGSGGV